jgi:hypothetical protein
MKITIEKTATVQETIELPEFFTTYSGWYFRVLSDDNLFVITERGGGIYNGKYIRHMEHMIKPCNQDDFVNAYAATLTKLQAYSGIEHLPLIDNTQNPE